MRLKLPSCVACVAMVFVACSRPPSASNQQPSPTSASLILRPPPELVGEAHLGRPSVSLSALATMAGISAGDVPKLVEKFGIDGAILSFVDTSKPVDIIMLGVTGTPSIVTTWTIAGPDPRQALPPRYRLNHVEGVGDVLEPSQPSNAVEPGLCAVVSAKELRLVCADDLRHLQSAARYAAEQSLSRAADVTDAYVELEGAAWRTALLPALVERFKQRLQGLASSGMAAMAGQGKAVDPAAAEQVVAEATRKLTSMIDDLRKLVLRVNVTETELSVDVNIEIDPAGASFLAQASSSHAGTASAKSLGAWFPASSNLVFASRSRSSVLNEKGFGGTTSLLFSALDTADSSTHAIWRNSREMFAAVGNAFAYGTSWQPGEMKYSRSFR